MRENSSKNFEYSYRRSKVDTERNSVQLSSIAQSCPALCNPMSCSTPGLPIPQPRGALSSFLDLRALQNLTWILFGHVRLRILLGEPAERQVGTFWAVLILFFRLWKDTSWLYIH